MLHLLHAPCFITLCRVSSCGTSHAQCRLPLLGISVHGVRSELIGRQALHAKEVRLARLPCHTLSGGPWWGTAPYGEYSTVAGYSNMARGF